MPPNDDVRRSNVNTMQRTVCADRPHGILPKHIKKGGEWRSHAAACQQVHHHHNLPQGAPWAQLMGTRESMVRTVGTTPSWATWVILSAPSDEWAPVNPRVTPKGKVGPRDTRAAGSEPVSSPETTRQRGTSAAVGQRRISQPTTSSGTMLAWGSAAAMLTCPGNCDATEVGGGETGGAGRLQTPDSQARHDARDRRL